MRSGAGIFFGIRTAWVHKLAMVAATMMLAISLNALAQETEIDPGKATGPEIQSYRDRWVPR